MKGAHFILRSTPNPSRANCVKAIWSTPNDWVVSIKPPTRSNIQSAKMHVVLGQLVRANVRYHGRRMDVEAWKDVLAASLLTAEQIGGNVVPTLDGDAYLVIGLHTSDLTSAEMSEIIERAYVIGAQNDPPVIFTEDIQPIGRP